MYESSKLPAVFSHLACRIWPCSSRISLEDAEKDMFIDVLRSVGFEGLRKAGVTREQACPLYGGERPKGLDLRTTTPFVTLWTSCASK